MNLAVDTQFLNILYTHQQFQLYRSPRSGLRDPAGNCYGCDVTDGQTATVEMLSMCNIQITIART